MNASVTWEKGLTFKGTADSGFAVELGGSSDAGGDEDGFRPLELMLVSLAGCTGMDVISILLKKRQQISGFLVRVEADQAQEHPKVFTAVRVHYTVTGPAVDPKAVERAIELSETKYCPAQAMLVRAVPITHTYDIVVG